MPLQQLIKYSHSFGIQPSSQVRCAPDEDFLMFVVSSMLIGAGRGPEIMAQKASWALSAP